MFPGKWWYRHDWFRDYLTSLGVIHNRSILWITVSWFGCALRSFLIPGSGKSPGIAYRLAEPFLLLFAPCSSLTSHHH